MAPATEGGSYGSFNDPYCYPGTNVLRNKRNLTDQVALDRFEVAITIQRGDEPLPSGSLDVSHYRAIHRHIFQDVYSWAGDFRTVRLSKGESTFCYPEHIDARTRELFRKLRDREFCGQLNPDDFAACAANFLAELNAIHPFREGNGRAQIAFLALHAEKAGHPIDVRRIDGSTFLPAMIESFGGSEGSLIAQIRGLIVE